MKEKEEARLNELKKLDREFYEKGLKLIAGIDEAGREPLAWTSGCCVCYYASRIIYRRCK